MNEEIYQKLTALAYKRSKPFCYQCYHVVSTESGHCPTCGSDDNMRIVDGIGCEFGTEWILNHILETELEPVNLGEAFEQYVSECYPETTKVGWCEFDTVTLLKEQDPISWSCAQSEWESQEAEAGTIVSFDNGSTYYQSTDVENLLEEG